jgi:hypothetical protein
MSPETQSIVAYTSLCIVGVFTITACCIFRPCKKEPRRVRFHPVVEQAEFTPLSDVLVATTIADIEKIDVELVI